MSECIFSSSLKSRVELAGLAPHAVAVAAGINPPNFYNILSGRKKPSDGDIERLSRLPDLNVSRDELLAWRDLDRLGPEGIERLKALLVEQAVQTLKGFGDPEAIRRAVQTAVKLSQAVAL